MPNNNPFVIDFDNSFHYFIYRPVPTIGRENIIEAAIKETGVDRERAYSLWNKMNSSETQFEIQALIGKLDLMRKEWGWNITSIHYFLTEAMKVIGYGGTIAAGSLVYFAEINKEKEEKDALSAKSKLVVFISAISLAVGYIFWAILDRLKTASDNNHQKEEAFLSMIMPHFLVPASATGNLAPPIRFYPEGGNAGDLFSAKKIN